MSRRTHLPSNADIDRLYGLEPLIEPGAAEGEPAADEAERFVDIGCPYCGEHFDVRVDLSAGAQSYVEDCQVCCQPMAMDVRVDGDGRFEGLVAARLDV